MRLSSTTTVSAALLSLLSTSTLATPSALGQRALEFTGYTQETLESATAELQSSHGGAPALNLSSSALTGGRRPAVLAAVEAWVSGHFGSVKAKRDSTVADVDSAEAGAQLGVALSPVRIEEGGKVVFGDGAATNAVKRDRIADVDSGTAGEQVGVTLAPVRFEESGAVVFGDATDAD